MHTRTFNTKSDQLSTIINSKTECKFVTEIDQTPWMFAAADKVHFVGFKVLKVQ